MDSYTSFAQVYDLFQDNVPYEEWCGYVEAFLKEAGISQGLVLDLGCGTGTLTELLAKKGYEMIGVDNSWEMLEIAMDKARESRQDILYLLQDMREFELYGTVAAVVSICDSMNYILDFEDLVKVFSLVNNYLDPGGIFIFDLNTLYKYREVLGNNTFAEDREESSFIWENFYDEQERINEYDLTLFIPVLADSGQEPLYRKFQETHLQRAYELEEIREAIARSGMEFVKACVWEQGEQKPAGPRAERIYVIAREHGKKKQ